MAEEFTLNIGQTGLDDASTIIDALADAFGERATGGDPRLAVMASAFAVASAHVVAAIELLANAEDFVAENPAIRQEAIASVADAVELLTADLGLCPHCGGEHGNEDDVDFIEVAEPKSFTEASRDTEVDFVEADPDEIAKQIGRAFAGGGSKGDAVIIGSHTLRELLGTDEHGRVFAPVRPAVPTKEEAFAALLVALGLDPSRISITVPSA